MITNSWTSSVSGDWDTATLWSLGVIPNSGSIDASIAHPGRYVVTIGSGKSETVDLVALGNPAATLSVLGDLTLTGTAPSPVMLGSGAIITTAEGVVQGSGALTESTFLNAGTLIADGGSGTELINFASVTNRGTLWARNGDLLVVEGITNLTGSALVGGTYIASGFFPSGVTSVADNALAFGFTSNADLAVDDATIILDGPASLIEGYSGVGTSGAAQVRLEDQLQTIAAGGTLELLDGRGFAATNPLLDAGRLVLGGGTLASPGLTVASGGTLTGYGVIENALTNQGAVIAKGGSLGSLIIQSPLAGAGSVTVSGGSTLVLPGGSAAELNVGGLLYDTGTLQVTGAVAGTGTIVVEHGGALELGGSATPALSFAGSNATVTLDHPASYQGTLIGFGQGDSLILGGLRATSAKVVNHDTLAVMAGDAPIASIALDGDYSHALFNAAAVGGSTVITNTAGAPARNDLAIDLVSVSNPIGLAGTEVAAIEHEVTLAAENWGQYINGVAPLRVSLTFVDGGDFGSELAAGAPGGFVTNGKTLDGHDVFVPDSLDPLTTGDYAAGLSTDIAITLIASATNLDNFYFDPGPAAGTPVPAGKIDLLSVLTHEFGHGLGFLGFADRTAPASGVSPIAAGAEEALYDSFIQDSTIDGTVVASFDGAHAEAAYGASIHAGTSVPVPLYFTKGSLAVENFYHVGGGLRSSDLMSPILPGGTFVPISNVDLGILRDLGVPVTAQAPCFARGTRIETTTGPVAVEDLTLAHQVVTASGVTRPVIWIGFRHIDCRRHPRPARVLPIRIAAGAFADGIPVRDLCVSPSHSIYFEDVLIPAYCLSNNTTITQLDWDSVDYFHVELPTHDILLAEGLPVESYLENGDRHTFANASGKTPPHGELAGDRWDAFGYAPLLLCGRQVKAARNRLIARSSALTAQ